MRLDIFVHVVGDNSKQDLILAKLDEILQKEDAMAVDFSQLQQDVANDTNVVSSAVTLLQSLKAQLDAALALGDPAQIQSQIQQISQSLEANSTALAQAVVANTPAASQPPATPTV